MPGSAPHPEQLRFASDGRTPNSPHPLLIYRQLPLADGDLAVAFERLFDSHLWPAAWRGSIYDYQHYHSTAHEVLGVCRGWARVMLGGERGREVELRAGDALVLPAGTGHCCMQASADFQVVAGYPAGQHYDLLRPDEAGHDAARERIAQVGVPISDPLAGTQGALVRLWREASLSR
ncbi:double-stranded beta helix domain-containing protein [Pseudomonas sp. BAY1663]|uniref:cupin domain-containing protein n=1 Tax=Pseudomonas sp. BAY1663 TaxID=1439940 RepID=UPI00042DE34D|nr:cupin domain-containing protein [Pseudomonas sp. BAY1663]EXF44909.1 double-stranded beta helix domain-containing protein [Pseudomonas sp. BAY1663]